MTATQRIERECVIDAGQAGRRLDQALAAMFSEFSRSQLQRWLASGAITVDGTMPQRRSRVAGGERVSLSAELAEAGAVTPEAIPLDVQHEDDAILVINKPAGLVVHPGAGNPDGTLQNALLYHYPELDALPRSGLVHRLDRDTSGLMVIARSHEAHQSLVDQLQSRTMGRAYQALVAGQFTAGGLVDQPIGRHPADSTRMAVRREGRRAVTHYRIVEAFAGHTLLRCNLETGRTHQIRVHLAYIRHPIVGDPTYGGRLRLPPGADEPVTTALRGLGRQALHAERLTLHHPRTGESASWTAEPPDDLKHLLAALRCHRDGAG